MPFYRYVVGMWVAVGIVWLIASFAAKKVTRRQTSASRLVQFAIIVIAYALVFSTNLDIGPLAWRVLPDSPIVGWTGLIIAALGCGFAVWARLLLGGNWSATVTVKQDHQLIRRGPYRIVRHPIYFGLLLGLLGAAIALDELRGYIGVTLALISWRMKLQVEESFMMQEFGADYAAYRREVKALIPFVL